MAMLNNQMVIIHEPFILIVNNNRHDVILSIHVNGLLMVDEQSMNHAF